MCRRRAGCRVTPCSAPAPNALPANASTYVPRPLWLATSTQAAWPCTPSTPPPSPPHPSSPALRPWDSPFTSHSRCQLDPRLSCLLRLYRAACILVHYALIEAINTQVASKAGQQASCHLAARLLAPSPSLSCTACQPLLPCPSACLPAAALHQDQRWPQGGGGSEVGARRHPRPPEVRAGSRSGSGLAPGTGNGGCGCGRAGETTGPTCSAPHPAHPSSCAPQGHRAAERPVLAAHPHAGPGGPACRPIPPPPPPPPPRSPSSLRSTALSKAWTPTSSGSSSVEAS